MDQARTLWILLVAIGVLLVVAPLGGASQPDATVHVHADEEPTTDSKAIRLHTFQAAESYGWTVNVTDSAMIVDLVLDEGFDVDRPRQLVPRIDGTHFAERSGDQLSSEAIPPPSFNLTTRGEQDAYRLGLPGPGEGNLTLDRDTQPPEVTVDPVTNLTHYGFDVTTRTPEPAMGKLVLERPDGTTRTQTTAGPGTPQSFPVIGLDPDTTYAFHVEVWDWSNNRAKTPKETVTTRPEPDHPGPVVEIVSPSPNETVSTREDITIEVAYQAEGSSIDTGGINLFFDKQPIPNREIELEEDRLRYVARAPFEAREHAISVEVPTEDGGLTVERWSVHVQDEGEARTPFPVMVTVPILALVSLARVRP